MNEREQKIRELIERVTATGSGVSREFTILTVDAAEFLLMELDNAREQEAVTLSRGEVEMLCRLIEHVEVLPRSTAAQALVAKLKGTPR